MAFDNRGAIWLQDTKDLWNPYFGASMPKCGEVTEILSAPRKPDKEAADHGEHPGL